MKHYRNLLASLLLFFSFISFAQKSDIYTNPLKEYNHAIELYNNRDFVAARHLFDKIKSDFSNDSEYKANCEYYAAFSTIQLR